MRRGVSVDTNFRTVDPRRVLLDRRGSTCEVTLNGAAIQMSQEVELVLGFDAFGNDQNIETFAETDDGADDRGRLRIAS